MILYNYLKTNRYIIKEDVRVIKCNMNSAYTTAESEYATGDSVYVIWRKTALSKMILSGTIACYRVIRSYMRRLKTDELLELSSLFESMRQIMHEQRSHMMQWTDPRNTTYSKQAEIGRLLMSDITIDTSQMMSEAIEQVIRNTERKIMSENSRASP